MYTRFNKRSKKNTNKINTSIIAKTGLGFGLSLIVIFLIVWGIFNIDKNKDTTSMSSLPSKNLDNTFAVKELTLYSSANAKKSKSLNSGLDISQYTDISFYVENPTGKTIKSFKICEMFFDPYPRIGNPMLAYKDPLDFGKLSNFDLQFDDEINFKITDTETDIFNEPTMYNNLSSPVTLVYLNSNIKQNFTVNQNETTVFYDGRLLKVANIDVSKLACNASFKIKITDLSNKEYEGTVSFDIPFKSTESTILDGSILTTIPVQCTFYSY